jgi:hypothetical protein
MSPVEEGLLGLFGLIGCLVFFGTVAYIILWLMTICDYYIYYKCRPEAVVQVCIIMLMFLFI